MYRRRVHGSNDGGSLIAPKSPVLVADWFCACPQRLPVRDPSIVRAQSHRSRAENCQDAQSFISYLFSYNQSVLFKKEEGGDITADQGKWILLREPLYIIAPEGLAVPMIIKETNGVGFQKRSSSPCICQIRYNKMRGLFPLLDPRSSVSQTALHSAPPTSAASTIPMQSPSVATRSNQ